jgi:hydrogenase maturation factor HypF (carbamoyltransferase family)
MMASAFSIRVRGVVQGVGFRPFVYRLARANTLAGWVLNGEEGVEIYLEGAEPGLQAFVQDLKAQPPPAASIAQIEVHRAAAPGLHEFTIRESQRRERPTVCIAPDLPVCDACLKELFDSADRRYWYPYINCTNCGPRYTVLLCLPYDRPSTTMKHWVLDDYCDAEYQTPRNRRFHGQPVACPICGPSYYLYPCDGATHGSEASIRKAVQLLNGGGILACKGIWGGEVFVGSVKAGFERVAHLRGAWLPGGDAAAQYPVQAAAGFLAQLDCLPDLTAAPFGFSERYQNALELVNKDVGTFPSTSVGRLFDAAAALLGFTREVTFEGQAAMWLEQLARSAAPAESYPFPFTGGELDFRPLLQSVVRDRLRGRALGEIARAFQRGLGQGLRGALIVICQAHNLNIVVVSGGVFQNELLLEDLKCLLENETVQIWTNHAVPPNDGGIAWDRQRWRRLADSIAIRKRCGAD